MRINATTCRLHHPETIYKNMLKIVTYVINKDEYEKWYLVDNKLVPSSCDLHHDITKVYNLTKLI